MCPLIYTNTSSLEKSYKMPIAFIVVNCRIGSLETGGLIPANQLHVNCRIGSLERYTYTHYR